MVLISLTLATHLCALLLFHNEIELLAFLFVAITLPFPFFIFLSEKEAHNKKRKGSNDDKKFTDLRVIFFLHMISDLNCL